MKNLVPNVTHEPIVVSQSVSDVRGARFSTALREAAEKEWLQISPPQGASIMFHNTEHSPLTALDPFLGIDRVYTKRDRATLIFDWSKTGLVNHPAFVGSCELPDRLPALIFGGFEISRESFTKWFDRLRNALPTAIDNAKFFDIARDEYRPSMIGEVVRKLLNSRKLLTQSGHGSGVFVLGNGYPDFVAERYQALMVVGHDRERLEEQSRVICSTLGGQPQSSAVIGGGTLISLGKSEVYLLTEEC